MTNSISSKIILLDLRWRDKQKIEDHTFEHKQRLLSHYSYSSSSIISNQPISIPNMTNKNDSKTSTDLKLLDLTLKNAGAIQLSCMGDFTAPSSQEIVVGRSGGAIEIYRIETSSSSSNNDGDDDDDEEEEEQRTWLKLILRTETRSTLRSIETVRLGGEKRDLVLIGSDSGCVSVLDFEGGQKAKILHCPVLGKTGT